MRKYINLIPLLKTQYEKEVTEESLVTEELLDEDKIPFHLIYLKLIEQIGKTVIMFQMRRKLDMV